MSKAAKQMFITASLADPQSGTDSPWEGDGRIWDLSSRGPTVRLVELLLTPLFSSFMMQCQLFFENMLALLLLMVSSSECSISEKKVHM